MRKFRVFLVGTVLAASTVVVTASPAAASCHLPKPGCTAYYTVCAVAYQADLFQCVD